MKDLTIITPSQWLADLVKHSFLKDYPVAVIHNGIDLHTFRPTASDFREKQGFAAADSPGKPKHMILGVCMEWSRQKGLDVFQSLAAQLGDNYRIVLVGTNEALDAQLPPNILSIHRTHDAKELAAIYTAADVFVNPTREDNFPTVNIEALACGTPVLTFAAGGSPEIPDDSCGSVVSVDDIEGLRREIERICERKPYPPQACTARAAAFEREAQFAQYLRFYES